MAAAQKARWAKIREAEPTSSLAEHKPARQKRKLSAAGRKAISEATKRRWAEKRSEAQSKAIVAKRAVSKKSARTKSAKKSQKTSEATVTATAQ